MCISVYFIMFKSFKYRLRPTKKQILLAHIEECRPLLYNQLVCARVQAVWDEQIANAET